jgi:hypothetical protein
MPITNVQELREHLQLAIAVELSTVPAYLYAMYSIADRASEATKLIRSIAAEEMLHATLMANVLLAVGGEPRFYGPDTIPSFPVSVPHHRPPLVLGLEPFSRELVERTFLAIERPAEPGAPAEADEWESLGQFYRALEQAMVVLDAESDLFADPRPERQLHDPHGYLAPRYDAAASGGLVVVDNLRRSVAAMEVVVHQGEGVTAKSYADRQGAELTHYAKFRLLHDGTIPVFDVRPAVVNPTAATLAPEVRPVAELFNALYSYLFVMMDRLMAPETEDRHHVLGTAYGTMVALLAPVARYLMTLPVGDALVAGPTFEYHRFADVRLAEAELRAIAEPLLVDHPTLGPALRQLDRLGG